MYLWFSLLDLMRTIQQILEQVTDADFCPLPDSCCRVWVMELKVWVDGVARVVCGLSPNTSCQDVVVALAQSIGKFLLWI